MYPEKSRDDLLATLGFVVKMGKALFGEGHAQQILIPVVTARRFRDES